MIKQDSTTSPRSLCASALLGIALAMASCQEVTDADSQQAIKPAAAEGSPMNDNADAQPAKLVRSDDEWRERLTPQQYRVLREKGTERAFTGKYNDTKTEGVYKCAGCGEVLFVSQTKFDSGCGWPSFFQPATKGAINEHHDSTLGMERTEVVCSNCGGHLGHVFNDGPRETTGLRYCINSASIDLQKSDADGDGEVEADGTSGLKTKH